MGAQLSVVVYNKCGCARTCYWFLELLICIPRWNFKIVVSLHVLCIEKKKKKRENKNKNNRKEKKTKKRNKRSLGLKHCVRTIFGSVGVWDYFHA